MKVYDVFLYRHPELISVNANSEDEAIEKAKSKVDFVVDEAYAERIS